MKTTVEQLLPTTTYGTPSGNYDGSSLDFDGVRRKAPGYYTQGANLQTLGYFLSAFTGKIVVEASLASEPTDSDWFTINTYDATTGSPITRNFSVNANGNFVWVRANVVNFSAGTITKLTIAY